MSEKDIRKYADQPGGSSGLCPFGRWLEDNRSAHRLGVWKMVFFGLLALMVVLNLIVSNHHPHFAGMDAWPGFWPLISFVMGVAMIFFVKKIVQPFIKRPEDYYGDL